MKHFILLPTNQNAYFHHSYLYIHIYKKIDKSFICFGDMGQYVCPELLIQPQLELENFIELHHALKSKA